MLRIAQQPFWLTELTRHMALGYRVRVRVRTNTSYHGIAITIPNEIDLKQTNETWILNMREWECVSRRQFNKSTDEKKREGFEEVYIHCHQKLLKAHFHSSQECYVFSHRKKCTHRRAQWLLVWCGRSVREFSVFSLFYFLPWRKACAHSVCMYFVWRRYHNDNVYHIWKHMAERKK